MARATKKVYKVYDKTIGKYIHLGGYTQKATWLAFPHEAIRSSKGIKLNPNNFQVDVFELVLTKSLDTEGKELQ